MIEAARQQWERDTDTGVLTQTWRVQFAEFPVYAECFKLPMSPLQSITSIKYYDQNNTQQTLASSVYSVNSADAVIELAYDQVWPSTVSRWDAVEIDFVIGYSSVSDVPAIVKQAMLLLIGHYFENRDMLMSAVLQSFRPYEALVRKYMRSTYP